MDAISDVLFHHSVGGLRSRCDRRKIGVSSCGTSSSTGTTHPSCDSLLDDDFMAGSDSTTCGSSKLGFTTSSSRVTSSIFHLRFQLTTLIEDDISTLDNLVRFLYYTSDKLCFPRNSPRRHTSHSYYLVFPRNSFGTCAYAGHPNIRKCSTDGFFLLHASSGVLPSTADVGLRFLK